MADTPKEGETVTPGDSKTEVTTPSAPQSAPAPQVNTTDNSEVDKLKKELEQAQMRANQLENEKKKRDEADAEAKRKQLEEQDEWKQIAEQERIKREELENERQEAERTQTLKFAEDTIFAEFSEDAIEVAKEAGLSLKDDSDEAKADFKTKLQKISDKVVNSNKVTPNNPGGSIQNEDRSEKVAKMRQGDKQARDEVIGGLEVLDRMRAQAGYTKQQ